MRSLFLLARQTERYNIHIRIRQGMVRLKTIRKEQSLKLQMGGYAEWVDVEVHSSDTNRDKGKSDTGQVWPNP